jgi:hypothetical protein
MDVFCPGIELFMAPTFRRDRDSGRITKIRPSPTLLHRFRSGLVARPEMIATVVLRPRHVIVRVRQLHRSCLKTTESGPDTYLVMRNLSEKSRSLSAFSERLFEGPFESRSPCDCESLNFMLCWKIQCLDNIILP